MRDFVTGGIVLAALGTVVLAGCATAQKMQVGSGDVVADRQRLMRLNGASMRDIGDKAKAGNLEAIAVNAETIALNAQHIAVLFPPGSMSDKSKAKAEIWSQRAEFEASAKKLETLALQLKDAAAKKDAAAVQAVLPTFARDTCGACHNAFRRS
jgi:cytochrome c556